MFKIIQSTNGVRYMQDGKFIAKAKIPEDELVKLNTPKDAKGCLFCGTYSNWSRLVNNKIVYLCENHYYDTTIGQIAQKLNEGQ